MSRTHRLLAALAASALASAGLVISMAPAASAAPLPDGCSAGYYGWALQPLTAPANTVLPNGSKRLDVTENVPGACDIQVNQQVIVEVTNGPASAADIILEGRTGFGGDWERIPLTGSGDTFTGIWGPPDGFSLIGAKGTWYETRITAPAGHYTTSVQLRNATSDEAIDGFAAGAGVNTFIAPPVTTTADRTVAAGGKYANPIVSTVSGTASNPQSPYTYSAPNPAFPKGVTMRANGEIGALAGTRPGTWTGTITATDKLGQAAASDSFTLTIVAPESPTVTGDQDMWGVAGKAFSNTSVKASGGTPPYTYDWAINPATNLGLTINHKTGAISGTIGKFTFDEPVGIRVTDAAGAESTYSTTLHVLGFNASGSSVVGDRVYCEVGKPFSVSFTAAGLGGHAGTYSSATPVSHSGLTLTTDGKLTGTPTNCDFLEYTYTLTDAVDGRTFSRTFADESLETDAAPATPAQKPLADSGSDRTAGFATIGLAAIAMGLAAYFISRRLREDVHAIV